MASQPVMSPVLGSFELVSMLADFASNWQLQQLRVVCSAADRPVRMVAQSRESAVYVCGGTNGNNALNSAEYLRPGADQWEPLPSFRIPRVGAVGVAYRGCLFLCGGSDEGGLGQATGNNLCSVDCFNPEHYAWEDVPDMLERRTAACGAALGDHLYVVGGEGGGHREFVLGTVERLCYDTSISCSDRGAKEKSSAFGWETAPPMRFHRFGAACVSLQGRLYVCGGSIGLFARRSAESFDPASGQWESLPDMCHWRVGAIAAAHGRRILICGGDLMSPSAPTMEQFDIDLHAWSELTPLSSQPSGLLPGLASAGSIFLFGPTLLQAEDLDAYRNDRVKKLAVSVDLATREVSRLPDTHHARAMSTAVRLKL